MPEADFYLKRNDTSSSIASTVLDANEDAVDIQGATVRFKMQSISGGSLVVDDTGTNVQVGDGDDGSKGQVVYGWASVPATAGLYLGEWEIHYANGSVQSFPNDGHLLIRVTPDLPTP